ncbi:hypothetical protein PHYSODRAFT_551848 [Phytophthora sojae]|uniref:Uncharacterized protein n=1 Tax=Phytophthora sojae (strain P6497) TaxID=1094619 RepID=G4YGK6_PHYSP|nr:hypothetical protein PHYSODRAFT_551848 [Phytophthora sojae]EGZ26541.1 hypothetical protein PHYSODRAFT_551848 [Phytophthora sojae]|eukprot:XP_009513816.1 hypothetical protein PHYSODRAFT_551848 [Phytophthora sojae]
MGSAREVLLAAAVAVAIAADARADLALSSLTLSPDADSLITTRGDSTTAGTSPSAVIGSAASNTQTQATDAPVTEAPFTWAPATTAPSTTAPPTTYWYSTSDSREQDTIDSPSTATVAPSNKASQTETQTAASSASKSTTATVDQLNDKNGGFSSGNSSSGMLGTAVPAVLGALACVGAIVMAVTYKRKSNTSDEDGARPNSDCEYTGDIDFTPENRKLTSVPENSPTAGVKAAIKSSQTQSVDFSASNSSRSQHGVPGPMCAPRRR